MGRKRRLVGGDGCLNNRYHDPALGSFLSVDPLVHETGEPYVYGSANPATLSDPSGLCSADPAERQQCEAEASGPGSPVSFWWQSAAACARGNVAACSTTKDDVGLESLSPSLEGVPAGGPAYQEPGGVGFFDRLVAAVAGLTSLDEIPLGLLEAANLRGRGASRQGPGGLPAEVEPLTTDEFQQGVECFSGLLTIEASASYSASSHAPELLKEPVGWAMTRAPGWFYGSAAGAGGSGAPSALSCLAIGD